MVDLSSYNSIILDGGDSLASNQEQCLVLLATVSQHHPESRSEQIWTIHSAKDGNFASFYVAHNTQPATRVPSEVKNGQSKFGEDPIRRSRDIRSVMEVGKSRRRGRSREYDDSLVNFGR